MLLTTHLTLMTSPDDQQHNRRSTSDLDRVVSGSERKPSDDHSWQRGFAAAWMVLGAAPSGLLIGYFIDRAYGTEPWWMLGLSLVFLAVSLYPLVKGGKK